MSRLGLSADDAMTLRKALIEAARNNQTGIKPTSSDEFGQRYVLDFDMRTAVGSATIRSIWIVRMSENVLRLTTCYVL